MNLSINNSLGQCYDGAYDSIVTGCKSGNANRISDLEPKALYSHYYGHVLNLAVQETPKVISIMKNALNIVHEITKSIKKAPKRECFFKKV